MKFKLGEHMNLGSFCVIAATFVLFVLALFSKGFTHDLFLESAIFLVSLKLILMVYWNSVSNQRLRRELEEIRKILDRKPDK